MLRLLIIPVAAFCIASCGAPASPEERIRIATFNVAMGLDSAGDLAAALSSGTDQRLKRVASIVRQVNPDLLLLNEFDYDPKVDAANLFNANYLGQAHHYPFHFRAQVNTGVDSELDLDRDGKTGGPGDAWGYGYFPGHYGMLVLSRYPIRVKRSRTFRNFRWSDLPGALRPGLEDEAPFHDDKVWRQLKLSSKSHWDLVIDIKGSELHLLTHHPTPPVFDGPEDYNGRRNFDEIRFWLEYTRPESGERLKDDQGRAGGIEADARFVMAGDFNADPLDGDSRAGSIAQLLQAGWINAACTPVSTGAVIDSERQGGINLGHRGDPAADTADFNDQYTGNLRLDYLLPSRNLTVSGCGVFWPAPGEPGRDLISVSDHRLVWLDILW